MYSDHSRGIYFPRKQAVSSPEAYPAEDSDRTESMKVLSFFVR